MLCVQSGPCGMDVIHSKSFSMSLFSGTIIDHEEALTVFHRASEQRISGLWGSGYEQY